MNNLNNIEKQVRNMTIESKVKVGCTCETIQEFHAISRSDRFKHIRVIKPYEDSNDQNFYFFKYRMSDRPNILIIVKSPEVAKRTGILFEPKVSMLTSIEITTSFNEWVDKVRFNRTDIRLKDSNMHTSKLVIEFMDDLRMHTVIQLSKSQKILVFAN